MHFIAPKERNVFAIKLIFEMFLKLNNFSDTLFPYPDYKRN